MPKHFLPSLLSFVACCAYSQDDSVTVPADMQMHRTVRAQQTDDARPQSETLIVRGIVAGIDPVNRLFALTNSAGNTITIYAGRDVQDFERVRLGEPASVRYARAVALAIARNGVFGEQAADAQADTDPLSQPFMDIPAERLQAQTSMFGKVAAIDLRNRYVIIEDHDGQTVEIQVLSDAAIAKLK